MKIGWNRRVELRVVTTTNMSMAEREVWVNMAHDERVPAVGRVVRCEHGHEHVVSETDKISRWDAKFDGRFGQCENLAPSETRWVNRLYCPACGESILFLRSPRKSSFRPKRIESKEANAPLFYCFCRHDAWRLRTQ
ncbi:MAG: hypothetical protein A2945_01135 [Candidatus Liptonbacteria bacterium RIFCSPLOWO2_01_FULL_52_25]|uniref:Uncharacterized protein n=1 Tax=Candidatus Liptonbacteria bacterium RIFCSPLOWO2_01_FULL_52_25 TaxID=1798650 RepID=A0A1G2CDI1_9BACT|nr:MAG: hypothetical protein A2945_01135 [Candidatus Liptonbacteria bacterium RIFCSPLOWO2_01_FULL_52_25]